MIKYTQKTLIAIHCTTSQSMMKSTQLATVLDLLRGQLHSDDSADNPLLLWMGTNQDKPKSKVKRARANLKPTYWYLGTVSIILTKPFIFMTVSIPLLTYLSLTTDWRVVSDNHITCKGEEIWLNRCAHYFINSLHLVNNRYSTLKFQMGAEYFFLDFYRFVISNTSRLDMLPPFRI